MASSYVTALYFTTSSLTSVGFGNVSGKPRAQPAISGSLSSRPLSSSTNSNPNFCNTTRATTCTNYGSQHERREDLLHCDNAHRRLNARGRLWQRHRAHQGEYLASQSRRRLDSQSSASKPGSLLAV